jgi:hypothetical protein
MVKGVLQLRAVLHDPALESGVDWHPVLLHEFFHMPIAYGVRPIPAHAHEHDLLREMGPLAADHPCSPSLVQSGLQRERIPEIVQE